MVIDTVLKIKRFLVFIDSVVKIKQFLVFIDTVVKLKSVFCFFLMRWLKQKSLWCLLTQWLK